MPSIHNQLLLGLSVCLTLSACRGTMRLDDSLPRLEKAEPQGVRSDRSSESSEASLENPTVASNLAEEKAVTPGIIEAWKLATIGKDEKGAMAILEKLNKEHPNISTVQFMMGQVRELYGKNKEAVGHYQKAVVINKFSSMQTFKLAESLRKAGDFEGSLVYYRKLGENLERGSEMIEQDIKDRKVEYTEGTERLNMQKQLLDSVRLGLARSLVEAGGHEEEALQVLSKLQGRSPKVKEDALATLKKLVEKNPANGQAKDLLNRF